MHNPPRIAQLTLDVSIARQASENTTIATIPGDRALPDNP
jgi:hypothetical protein